MRFSVVVSSGLISRSARLSAAMSISFAGFAASGMARKYSPASTGESTSLSSDTGANSTVLADWLATGRDVPNFQPAGRFRFALKVTSLMFEPSG